MRILSFICSVNNKTSIIKMKVLHIVHAFTGGGIEQYLLNLADNIDREQYKLEVLGTCERDVFDRSCELEKRGIPFHRLKAASLFRRIREWQQLLRKEEYDIVHIQGMPNTGVIWLTSGKLARSRTRFIVHSHMGIRKSIGNSLVRRIAYKICYHMTNALYRTMADVRAGCSHDAMQFHFGKGIGTNGLLLNNGINLQRFRNLRCPQLSTRNIIIVARLAYQKNPFFVLDIIKHLVARHPEWKLTWVGAGHLEPDVKAKIHELNLEQHIMMLGARKDIPELLRQHSLFLLPSIHEALPISLIEAQAAGCLCLAADCVPEAANCGALLRLSLSQGAEAWADYIEQLHHEQKQYPIDEEKINAYDIRTTTAQVAALYSRMAKQPGIKPQKLSQSEN